ncbi:glycosyltransferase involved in cell wall biosynthesis [Streptomyces sp. 2333.5]|uniref:glycosyltransferase family 2 protein n=1 Tax=unclassified Streptomyces TaxID=2593676 RepID=UPI0008953F3D|nr:MULTISPECIES: glycosyltransferase family 2 protein [unclassified Streptomyces]PJJ02297.1 glycosyltransferase involved in cell wall biosynthesis [Streptomyces sp. 2333.5]SED03884.1 Glycosyltransferase involved in cell wall bisynthesis [Streptomyces sp. 2314.4]SED90289.1 Glycosyltransferase involved in cell wall bisynthesis [Streptomyces sp. 2112.2]
MKLSIVVPCYNEEAVLSRFDDTIRAVLAGLAVEYELCYVDDGSADGTLARLRSLAHQHRGTTRYLSFSRNFGKEPAILAGLRAADGDAVILMDADLQHPPELIEKMLDLYQLGHDQVVAKRTRHGDRPVRTALSRLYYRAVNRWVDVELTDGVGDFRLLSRTAVDALLSLPEYNRFSKGLFSWIGFDTVTFDYRNAAREAGETKWHVGSLVNYGIDGMLSFNSRPLRLAIYAGLALASLAALYALWIIGAALVGGVTAPGYVTLVAIIVGLGGLQMVMLGLIGEYIGRIYYETKRRPHFLVKESNTAVPAPASADAAAPAGSRAG